MRVRLSLRRLPRLTKVLAAMSIAVSAAVGSVALAAPAFASASGDLGTATNSARAAAGLPALQTDGQLSAVAQAWANHLAAANVLSHNGALRSQVSNWTYLGENVGFGADVPTVQQAFMNSPEHRSNILNSHYTLMGVGSATSTYPSCGCQVVWLVVDFKRPATAAAPVAAPAPVKAAPVKAAPVKAAPVNTAPVNTAPANTAPAKAAPVKAAPVTVHQAPPAPHRAAPVDVPVTRQVNPPAPATNTSNNSPSTATPSASTQTLASPSASASATFLGTQLAAAAAAPNAAKHDPVSQMLTFATVMSQLPN